MFFMLLLLVVSKRRKKRKTRWPTSWRTFGQPDNFVSISARELSLAVNETQLSLIVDHVLMRRNNFLISERTRAPLTQSEMRTRGIFTAPTVCNDRMPLCARCHHRSNVCCLCMSSVSSFAPLY